MTTQRKPCPRCGGSIPHRHSPFCTYLARHKRIVEILADPRGWIYVYANGRRALVSEDGKTWVSGAYAEEMGYGSLYEAPKED